MYRISLNTKSLRIALKRRNLLNLLNGEELLFTFQRGDYKLVFEYDTKEELEEYLKLAEASYACQAKRRSRQ